LHRLPALAARISGPKKLRFKNRFQTETFFTVLLASAAIRGYTPFCSGKADVTDLRARNCSGFHPPVL
jgi:hypothetical protein